MKYNLVELNNAVSEGIVLDHMSFLEQVVSDFINPEISTKAIESAKMLNQEELANGLEYYTNLNTLSLWQSLLNKDNMLIYLTSTNPLIIEMFNNFVKNHPDFNKIKAFYNPKTKICKIEEQKVGIILSKQNPMVFSDEIEDTINQLNELDEDININLPVTLENQQNGSFEMILGEKPEPKKSVWKDKLISPLNAMILTSAILMSVGAFAQDNDSKNAINSATKAAMANPAVKKAFDDTTDKIVKNAEDIVRESGSEIPVVIIGYGAKLAKDKEVKYKGKVGGTSIVPINYEMGLGINGYHMQISGDNPLDNKGKYYIKGSGNSGDTKVQLGLEWSY